MTSSVMMHGMSDELQLVLQMRHIQTTTLMGCRPVPVR
jgi:hypothetical protein